MLTGSLLGKDGYKLQRHAWQGVENKNQKNLFVNKVELDQTEKIETEFIHPRENIVHRNLELGL